MWIENLGYNQGYIVFIFLQLLQSTDQIHKFVVSQGYSFFFFWKEVSGILEN